MLDTLPSLAVATPSLIASGSASLNPNDTSDVPGAVLLSGLADGIGHYALYAAMIGILVGAVMWAFGHYSQNYQQALNGRRGVLVSALAAVLIGAAPFLINFFLRVGQGVNS
jgi:MFS family permease